MDRSKSSKSCHNHKPDYVVTPVVKEEADVVQRKFLVHISTIVFKAGQHNSQSGNSVSGHATMFSRDAQDALYESFDHDDEIEDGWTESSFGSSSSPVSSSENRKHESVRVSALSTAVLDSFPDIYEESFFYHRFTSTQVGAVY